MPTPHYISNGSQKLYLEYFGEYSERLHIITSCNPISIQFTIYEMQRDKTRRKSCTSKTRESDFL